MCRKLLIMVLVVSTIALTIVASGCGGGKAGSISRDTHGQIHNGMTMDDVDAVAGQPDRSHSIGAAGNPQVFWYYGKTDGEGFIRVVFEDGKVTTISPYDESFNPES